MIIDSHAHIGKILDLDMPKDVLIESMKKYKIDFSLVSSVEAAEYDGDCQPINASLQKNQVVLNTDLINYVMDNKTLLGALIWCKPHAELINEAFENLIAKNINMIYGLKFHPFHSQLAFNDERMEPYFELARKYNLPIVTHTANSYESSPKLVYEVAKKYPEIDFVMVHMGLVTDNLEAIELISNLPNLYGDTTWVKPENVLLAIKKCGTNKILFGTDNPIDGIDTLGKQNYQEIIHNFKSILSDEEYKKLMYKNAQRVFKI